MKKNVVILMPALYRGGAEKQFRVLIDELSKSTDYGTEFTLKAILSNSFENCADAEHNFVANHQNVVFSYLRLNYLTKKFKTDFWGKLYRIAASVKLNLLLLRLIINDKLDILLVYSGMGMYAIPLARMFKKKIYYSERNDGIAVCTKIPLKWFLKMCDGISANSESAKKEMESRGYIVESVIHNSITPVNVQPLFWNNGIINVLIPARICDLKNQMIVLKAISDLNNSFLKFMFAGVIEEEKYYEEMRNFITENKLEGSVVFLGFVNNMEELYRNAHIVILPSKSEGMPNVLLEGYLHKKVCIASSIEMNSVVIRNAERLFRFDSADELAKCLRKVLTLTEEDYQKEVEENYQYVLSEFSTQKFVEGFRKLLRV